MDINNFDFIGTAWPKARFENGFLIAGGKGHFWDGSVATPCWRDLAEIALGDIVDLQDTHVAEQALAFIRRHGLPGGYNLAHGPLPFAFDGSSPASEAFIRTARYFNAMTLFWQPLDENGVTYIRRIIRSPEISPLAEMLGNAVSPVKQVPVGRVVLGLQGYVGDPTVWMDCDSFDEYLQASMAIHLATRQTLAKCWWCGSWYAPLRPKRAHYCTSSCRSAASKAAKATKVETPTLPQNQKLPERNP